MPNRLNIVSELSAHVRRMADARREWGTASICPDCYRPAGKHSRRELCGEALHHGIVVAQQAR